jgi:hypothetical protein
MCMMCMRSCQHLDANMLNVQGYAVPYDFVDSSVTGALADFVAQTRMSGG